MEKDRFLNEINLNEYAKTLFERKNESIELYWADCDSKEWSPKVKECHKNVTELGNMNSELEPVRGWLMIDGEKSVVFVAHSVVKNVDGKFYDITPPNNGPRPPFIIANDNEETFEKMVMYVGDIIYHPNSQNA